MDADCFLKLLPIAFCLWAISLIVGDQPPVISPSNRPTGNADDKEASSHAIEVTDDNLDELIGEFDPYTHLKAMSEDDWEDLQAINIVFGSNRRKRSIKYMYERAHASQLININEFANRFRMEKHYFDRLLESLCDAITVDYIRSSQASRGKDPIYPEIILATGLRFLGLGSTVPDIADIYGISIESTR